MTAPTLIAHDDPTPADFGDTGPWTFAHPVGCVCVGCQIIRRMGPRLSAPAWPKLVTSASPPGALTPTVAKAQQRARQRRVRAGILTARQRATRIAVPWT